MKKELRDKVLPIARSVRKWAERKAEAAKYNPDTLCGWCAIASAHLFRALKNEGIESELHYVSGHCFVVVDDYVVDVTATQFAELRAGDVFIKHHKEVDQHWFYQSSHIFEKPMELREHQLKENWPRRQIAYTR